MKGDNFIPSGKKMYSTELKLEIIQRYLKENIGLSTLAGLCTTHGTYTGDFKVSVVKYIHNTGASLRQTAAHFNIPSFVSVSKYERIYYEDRKEALYEEWIGKASKMGTKRKKPQTLVITSVLRLLN